jgi:tetratricopeptide (TPR) repeat protein
MTLRPSLLRELVNPNLSVGGRAELCCELARDFENRGEYEEAREVLSVFWQRIGERPKLEGLPQRLAAEVLLRAGVLTGIIGSSRQIADAQETAKNLITESLTTFQAQRLKNKAAEAQIELALCYWRTGDYNNASDFLKLALEQLTTDSELRAKAIIRLAIVETDSNRLSEASQCLTDNAALFQKINNHTLIGCYYQTLADVFLYLWKSATAGDYLDRALVEYAAASYHFELADHRRYRANVENNLGLIYFEVNRCGEAHEHLDRARRIFASMKDKGAMAQVNETRARVLLKEKRYGEAEKVARASVRTLEKSDMQLPLVESLTTHGIALARLGNYGAALTTFRRAIDGSQQIGSLNTAGQAALTVFQEMGERLAVQDRGGLITGRSLNDEIQSLEHDLIKHALEVNEGSITRAAKNLGITYQDLHYMLNTRHSDLARLRTPVRRRPRRQE